MGKRIFGMMWFQMIEELNGRHILGGFNQSQVRELFQGFKNEIMNDIGGDRGGVGGGWLSRVMSRFGFLFVGIRYINGSVQ